MNQDKKCASHIICCHYKFFIRLLIIVTIWMCVAIDVLGIGGGIY
jgi:hypothetical protein